MLIKNKPPEALLRVKSITFTPHLKSMKKLKTLSYSYTT